MPERPLRRALLLMLLGMGAFFLVAAVLAFLLWHVLDGWRQFLGEIAFVAALTAIPIAYYVWTNHVAHHL